MPPLAHEAASHRNPGRLLNQVARLITRDFDRRLAPLGINVAYMPVLGALKAAGHLSQKELAEMGRIGQPAMAQMLDRMVKEGLLIRTTDSADRRRALFALSQKGRDLMPEVGRILETGNVEIFSALGSDGLGRLIALLRQLEHHLAGQDETAS